ncbi:hypothetical protein [Mariprofundus aestuarium]|nr:hypothetical protein [Mariprofundus aestuarium]
MATLKFLDLPRILFLILFLTLVVSLDLSDPDYFWHIKTGEQILMHGSLPSADIFSYTYFEHPWVLHEWLFQVLVFTIYHSLGPLGIKVMAAFLGMLALYFTYLAASHINHSRVLPALLILACIVPMDPFISPRPQLVSFVLFSLTMLILVQFKYLKRTRYLVALPAMMILWVNMHGGYVVGIALLMLFTMCEFISFWLGDRLDKAYRKQLSKLAFITLITFLSSALNPDFISHWLYPINVMSMEASRSFISEWRSPDFHSLSGQYNLLLIFGFFIAYAYREIKPDLTEVVLPVFFIAAGFVAYRHMPLAILTIIPFAGVAFAKGAAATLSEGPVGVIYKKYMSGGRQLGNAEYILNWVLTLIITALLLLSYPILEQRHQKERDSLIPVKATEFIIKAGLSGRMFNTYHFGGYLIYRLYPDQRVFIDGRADMYGDAFLKEYRKIYYGEIGWEKVFEKFAIDYVVCERDAPIRQLLMLRGDFRLVYDDEKNSVLVKEAPRYAEIIANFRQ